MEKCVQCLCKVIIAQPNPGKLRWRLGSPIKHSISLSKCLLAIFRGEGPSITVCASYKVKKILEYITSGNHKS